MKMKGAMASTWSIPVEILKNSVFSVRRYNCGLGVHVVWLNRFHNQFRYALEWEDIENSWVCSLSGTPS